MFDVHKRARGDGDGNADGDSHVTPFSCHFLQVVTLLAVIHPIPTGLDLTPAVVRVSE